MRNIALDRRMYTQSTYVVLRDAEFEYWTNSLIALYDIMPYKLGRHPL